MTKNIYVRDYAFGFEVFNNRQVVYRANNSIDANNYAIALGKNEKKNVYYDGDWKETLYKAN